jgi:hypothetical protein
MTKLIPIEKIINGIIRHPKLSCQIRLTKLETPYANDHLAHFHQYINHISGDCTIHNISFDICLSYQTDINDEIYYSYQVILNNDESTIFLEVDEMVDFINKLSYNIVDDVVNSIKTYCSTPTKIQQYDDGFELIYNKIYPGKILMDIIKAKLKEVSSNLFVDKDENNHLVIQYYN